MSPVCAAGGLPSSALLCAPWIQSIKNRMAEIVWHRRPLSTAALIGIAESFLFFATTLNMPWWFTCIILFVMWALLATVSIRSEWTVHRSWIAKGALCIVAALFVIALGAKSVRQQWELAYPSTVVNRSAAIMGSGKVSGSAVILKPVSQPWIYAAIAAVIVGVLYFIWRVWRGDGAIGQIAVLRAQLSEVAAREYPPLSKFKISELAEALLILPRAVVGRDNRHIDIRREELSDCMELADSLARAFRAADWRMSDEPRKSGGGTPLPQGIWVVAGPDDLRVPPIADLLRKVLGPDYGPIGTKIVGSMDFGFPNFLDKFLVVRIAIGRKPRQKL